MSNFNEQLNRMKNLISYGQVNESVKNNQSSLECHKEAADGKVYGIVRECHKFYIKTTSPEKANLVESYSYIGGWNNHKDYEYSDLRSAEKHLELKLRSINEALGVEQNENHIDYNQVITEGTESMAKELNRQREIMRNVSRVLTEGSCVAAENHTCGQIKADEKKPFTDKAVAKLDKDLTDKESDPAKAAAPFGDKGEEAKNTEVSVDNSVASAHPKGAMAVKITEDEEFLPEDFEPTDEDVDEIEIDDEDVENSDDDSDVEIDADTEVDTDVDDETTEDDIDLDDTDFEDKLDDLQSELDLLRKQFEEYSDEDEYEDEYEEDDVDIEDEDKDSDIEIEMDTDDDDNDLEDDVESIDAVSESKQRFLSLVTENVVSKIMKEDNEFGKHPGYRKKPMTTPPTEDNDDVPFGTKIGNTAPFKDTVNIITDQILASLKKKI